MGVPVIPPAVFSPFEHRSAGCHAPLCDRRTPQEGTAPMSQLTHPRAQILDLGFRFRAWLAVAAATVVVAIPTVLVISSDDDPAQSQSSPASVSGLRYDGGPDEGTRGQVTGQSAPDSSTAQGGQVLGARP